MNTIQIISDKMAIKEVLSQYAITVDTGDADGFASLFTEDAVWIWEAVDLTFRGRQTLKDLATAIDTHVPGALHMISHPVIELAEDKAATICLFTVFLSRPEKVYTLMAGNYRSELVKENGRWLIARHMVHVANPEILSQGKIGEYYQPLLDNLPQ